MKYLELPIKVSEYTETELDKFDDIGVPISDDGLDQTMYTNPDFIVAFIETPDGYIDLVLGGGMRVMVYLTLEEFKDILNDK